MLRSAHRLGRRALGAVAFFVVFVGFARAETATPDLPLQTLFAICESDDIDAAIRLGDAIGWRRAPQQDQENWAQGHRQMFPNGQTRIAGWRRSADPEGESLWVRAVSGGPSYFACDYRAPNGAALKEALVARFGPVSNGDAVADFAVAHWRVSTREIYLSGMPSGEALLTMARPFSPGR